MLKKQRGAHLFPEDLKWFGDKFLKGLRALWPDFKFRLGPEPRIEAPAEEEIAIVLTYQGRELGDLFYSTGQETVSGLNLLPELVRQGLETMSLHKALLTDIETGFLSRQCFRRRLAQALARRLPEGAVLNLSLGEETTPDLILVLVELPGSKDPARSLVRLSEILQEHIHLQHLCRLSTRRLGFLVEGRQPEVKMALENALKNAEQGNPVAAWACYPHDLGSNPGSCGRPNQQARVLASRARVALFQARQSGGLVGFGDLLSSHGKVIQVLPLDRVGINLGRSAGAAVGQVFLACSADSRPGSEQDYKGEVTIFEAGEDYSVARITGLQSSCRLVAGDRLHFSRLISDPLELQRQQRPQSGFLAELPQPEEFLEDLNSCSTGAVAVILAHLDNFEKNWAVLGREEGERRRSFIFEKVAASLPDTKLMTLWRPETLALAWVPGSQAELGPLAHRVVAELKEAGPVSLGLVFNTEPLESALHLVEDAQKALHEAAFSGPGQVAVFGPLALNISGDRLFEGGDLCGAMQEYERGLALAPEHLNLLNSLGVCHGRQGHSGRALSTFAEIARLDPDNMMAHYNLGYTHLLAGRLVEAEESLGRAAELAPDNFESLFHFGKTALELGHLDKALAALKKAGELGEGRTVVYRLLGEALLLAHDHQGALTAFKKAVKASPNDAYALSALGALFVDQANDLPVAKSLFQKSVELDPTNSLYRQRLGRLLFKLNEYTGAEHHLTMAMEYGSRAPEIHYHLGCVAEKTGRTQEALGHFKAALNQDPDYQPALERVSKCKTEDTAQEDQEGVDHAGEEVFTKTNCKA